MKSYQRELQVIEAGILKPLLELAKSTRVTENFLSIITMTVSETLQLELTPRLMQSFKGVPSQCS